MFYIRTADKLQRTAPWLESLPGGIKYLHEVIIEDKLGICASLEAQMKELVGSFFDEWAEAIRNPDMSSKFKQFQNTDVTVENVDTELDRGQSRPVYWPKDAAATEDFASLSERWSSTNWEPVIETAYFDGADELPNGTSATIKRGDTQLAVWRFRGKYYATQQMCPHKRAFVLSDGLIGHSPERTRGSSVTGSESSSSACSSAGSPSPSSPSSCSPSGTSTPAPAPAAAPAAAPWVSCPHHKRNFDLKNGSCSNDSALSIATFAVEPREDGMLYIKLPPVEELDAALGTTKWKVKKGESGEPPFADLDNKMRLIGKRGRKVNGAKPVLEDVGLPKVVVATGGCGSAPDW